RTAQGVLDHNGEPVRNAVEALIKKTDIPSAPTGFTYNFEKEGYVYAPKTELQPDGTKKIEHFIEKTGEKPTACGQSTISTNGVLENELYVPEKLRNKEVSKAIYSYVLKEDIKSIPTEYGADDIGEYV